MNKLMIFSGSSQKETTKKVCDLLDNPVGDIAIDKFPDGEKTVQFLDNIRGRDIFLIQSLITDADFMETFIMCDAARRASAKRITLVAPFVGYMRQDRKTKPRTPITARLVFDLLETAGVDRIVTIDLHNPAAQGFANCPVDNLYGSSLFFRKFPDVDANKYIVISPDGGGIKMAEAFSSVIGCDYGFIPKIRKNGQIITKDVQGDVEGKTVLIVDDMTETGGTLINAMNKCKEAGAEKVDAFVTHSPLTEEGKKQLTKWDSNGIVLTTNSVGVKHKLKTIKVLDISSILAKAIKRIHNNESLSELFEIKGF
ncbi:MAG: ribose-phosphate pyrophosphokinase [Flavobacteriales bacterium]|nr:ribose-phosphate pyrophosphokinase [Flavobacteriales bacterium]